MEIENEPVLRTDTFTKIFNVCKDALVNHKMIAVVGTAGFGKTTAINEFHKEFKDNTVVIKARKSMTPKIFFSTILNIYGDEKYTSTMNLYNCIANSARLFNNEEYNKLLIIDEAGKFNAPMLEYMHEFRDLTAHSTGIVLIGPEYFKMNIENWTEQNRIGIPEVYSRINSWQTLKTNSRREIIAIIKAWGITDENFIRENQNNPDLRVLVNNIKDHLLLLEINATRRKKKNNDLSKQAS